VRVLDETDAPVKPGGRGRIVATNFTNRSFGLVNYETNDYVEVAVSQHCLCGQKGLILDSIDGRIENYVILPDGRLIGRLDHIFKHELPVNAAQIVQNSADQIIIRIDRKSGYTVADERVILEEARIRLGHAIKIEFDYDTSPQRDKGGKFRFIQQNMKIVDRVGFRVNSI
jgi:phenylacetate-CoA ligase